jgi:glutamate formiminotransferase
MVKIIECIPNFSEGRDKNKLNGLISAASAVPGVMLADCSADANHNRSVFTLIGPPEAVEEAAFVTVRRASELIDLTAHSGEHPRMGAADVVPFVPVRGVEMRECVEISQRVAERISRRLGIPTFLYEESATREARRNLADIRRGGFEGMAEKLRRPEWAPDFGERKPHPTAGVTAVGARQPLIAFNINLSTSDVSIAKKIAKAVRGSNGGLRYCKALGILLKSRNTAQVSMNLVNYEATPLYRVFEMVKAEAARYGVGITGSELVGLAPAKALMDCAGYFLRMEEFDFERQVLENHVLK